MPSFTCCACGAEHSIELTNPRLPHSKDPIWKQNTKTWKDLSPQVKAIFAEAMERARNGKKLLAEHLAALEEVKSLLERWDDREI